MDDWRHIIIKTNGSKKKWQIWRDTKKKNMQEDKGNLVWEKLQDHEKQNNIILKIPTDCTIELMTSRKEHLQPQDRLSEIQSRINQRDHG